METKTKSRLVKRENPLNINKKQFIYSIENKDGEIDYLDNTKEIIKFICMEKDEFENNFDKFIEFINLNKHVRILYSEISIIIYEKANNLENININLEKIKDEIIDNKCKNYSEAEAVSKIIVKIYDHFNLAIYQLARLKDDDETFRKRVAQVIQPINDENKNKIDKKFSEIDSSIKMEAGNLKNEFIGLIGIFTAMSFLVFGGLEFLGGIFSKMEDVPILKLVIIGCIWGVCISNLMYAFMFFIESILAYKKEYGQPKYLKRYPMIIFSNYIFIGIFLFSSWAYYCRENNINNLIFNLANEHSMVYFIFLIFLLIGVLIFILRKLNISFNGKRN